MSQYAQDGQSQLGPSTSPSALTPPEQQRHPHQHAQKRGIEPEHHQNHHHGAEPRSKRAQVPRACERCRSLRRACSDYRPCKRCIDNGLAEQCLGMPGSVQIAWGPPASMSPGASWAGPGLQDSAHRLQEVLPARVLDYCAQRFLERLYPTIPILTHEHIIRLRHSMGPSESGLEAHATLVAMSAMVLLQAEEPESLHHQGLIRDKNVDYGRRLFDEASATQRILGRRPQPSFELCLLTFFLYACHAALQHHSQAFFFLREATTLWLLLKPDGDRAVDDLAGRLFWVLLVSERSHAIRYRRPVTLQITAETPSPAPASETEVALVGFWSLAALFRPLDTSFIAILNHEEVSHPPDAAALHRIETAINAALKPHTWLQDTQKANLRVTQLWLRIIIWQLRLRFGHLTEEAAQQSLTFHYPLEVAKDLTLSTRDLPLDSIKIHGVGLTEKLFDIASAVVDVLARVPISPSTPRGVGMGPEEDLNYLRRLITQLPGGSEIYDALLDRHIEQAVPEMRLGQVHSLAL
ncbi:RING-4 protein [Plectosphaerella cucumerina]|uniref:RING-4 protein n=1 Tax=Plectosphaerella cucumerina TaxID=40658 RepID=A0A8K0T3Y5_9PEZI|nr:RING-4 protein [Plectosphaerella cucumerina]